MSNGLNGSNGRDEKREKKKELLQKLINMSLNGTEHEKEVAAKKAQDIMSEWNLTEADVRKQSLGDITVQLNLYRLMDWQTYLYSNVATYAGCKMTFSHGYKKNNINAEITFYGRDRDIDNAIYISSFLFDTIRKMSQRYKLKIRKEDRASSAKIAGDRVAAYRFGLLTTFFSNLEERRREFFSENAGKGIIPLPTATRLAEAEVYMIGKVGEENIKRTEAKDKSGALAHSDLYVGLEDGKNIQLNKSIQ